MPASPPQSCRMSAVAASTASGGKAGSTPRSKRARASVLIWWRLPARATVTGSNSAHSRKTWVVSGVLPVDSPPMMPASDSAPVASAITRSCSPAMTSRPFSARKLSLRPARTLSVAPARRSASKTCSGRPRSCVKKLVMSTSALIGRRPIAVRRCFSQSGLGPLRRPRMLRPSTQGQACGQSTDQASGDSNNAGTAGAAQGFSVPRPAAARSRATPRTLSASPRLGVTPISITGSSRPAQAA